SDAEGLQTQLVEAQAEGGIGPRAGSPFVGEIAVVEAGEVPADREPAVLHRRKADRRADRITGRAAADATANGRRDADVDRGGEIEAQIRAEDVAPSPDVVRAQPRIGVARAPEDRDLVTAFGQGPVDREAVYQPARAGVALDGERPAERPRLAEDRAGHRILANLEPVHPGPGAVRRP